jgi:anion-transporting  ArsA/GET3 family ATPase
MRPPFFRDTRLLIVAGKGGVGKTTVAAVTAATAAAAGMRTLLVGIDSAVALAGRFEAPELQDTLHTNLGGINGLDARMISPDQALIEWLQAKKLGRLADRLVRNGALDMIATAVPGIRDILILGRIKSYVNFSPYDLIVLDGPASGHAITMLRSASGLQNAVTVGAIRQQADDVAELLADPALTQVVLVTIPEHTPMSETIETAFTLEEHVGVRLGPVVVNQVLTPRAGSLRAGSLSSTSRLTAGTRDLVVYRADREAAQHSALARLRTELPTPALTLPFVAGDGPGHDARRHLMALLELSEA